MCCTYCGWTKSCTTLKPWLKPWFVGIYVGASNHSRVSEGWCVAWISQPSTVRGQSSSATPPGSPRMAWFSWPPRCGSPGAHVGRADELSGARTLCATFWGWEADHFGGEAKKKGSPGTGTLAHRCPFFGWFANRNRGRFLVLMGFIPFARAIDFSNRLEPLCCACISLPAVFRHFLSSLDFSRFWGLDHFGFWW